MLISLIFCLSGALAGQRHAEVVEGMSFLNRLSFYRRPLLVYAACYGGTGSVAIT